ncbi:MAG: hypothetical protein J6W27_00055 [Alphaproteobacteria bacterium]|nr:hypothetical protein [Alphaproteobacteria bacterium]
MSKNDKKSNGCLYYIIIFMGLTILGVGLGSILVNKSENKIKLENSVKKWKLKNIQERTYIYNKQHTR